MGPEAFTSEEEVAKTVLHETFRLETSQAANGVSGELATAETEAAQEFADETYQSLLGDSMDGGFGAGEDGGDVAVGGE